MRSNSSYLVIRVKHRGIPRAVCKLLQDRQPCGVHPWWKGVDNRCSPDTPPLLPVVRQVLWYLKTVLIGLLPFSLVALININHHNHGSGIRSSVATRGLRLLNTRLARERGLGPQTAPRSVGCHRVQETYKAIQFFKKQS